MIWRIAFQAVAACAWGMSLLVAVAPLRLRLRTSLLLAALLALAFGKFAFFAVAGGDSFVPDLPLSVIWSYGAVYSWAMMFTGLAFVLALADAAFRLCGRPVALRTVRIRTMLIAIASAALSVWGIYEGVRVPCVRRVELSWKELPPAFDGYRIVHMSDLHCSTAARRTHFERIVDRVNSLDADIVAITGDFVDGHVADRERDLEPLAGLRARDGVVGCTGNHEAYWEWDRWGVALKRWGICFPEDSGAMVVRRGNDAIAIGAVKDPAFTGKKGRAVGAFEGVPAAAFRILLFHRPWTDSVGSAAMGARLQLSGHTHGGIMPLFRPIVALSNEGRTHGLYGFGAGRYLYLSPGTGQWAGFPLRLFNPTEITEIVLRRNE